MDSLNKKSEEKKNKGDLNSNNSTKISTPKKVSNDFKGNISVGKSDQTSDKKPKKTK